MFIIADNVNYSNLNNELVIFNKMKKGANIYPLQIPNFIPAKLAKI